MPSFLRPFLTGLAPFAMLAALGAGTAAADDVDVDDVERDDLPSSPHDLDAELTKIDPRRAAAEALRGIGIHHSFEHLGHFHTFEDDFTLLTATTNPRIIDVDRMHARDCAFDRVHGGMCVLRGFDENVDGIDVDRYGAGRAQRGRFEILERIIDSADVLDP